MPLQSTKAALIVNLKAENYFAIDTKISDYYHTSFADHRSRDESDFGFVEPDYSSELARPDDSFELSGSDPSDD